MFRSDLSHRGMLDMPMDALSLQDGQWQCQNCTLVNEARVVSLGGRGGGALKQEARSFLPLWYGPENNRSSSSSLQSTAYTPLSPNATNSDSHSAPVH